MLVLSREANQSVVLAGGEIVVTVLEIRGSKVRLGFEAAKDIPIHRKEVFDAIQRESTAEQTPPVPENQS